MDGSVDPTMLFRSPTRAFGDGTDEELAQLVLELTPAEDDEENTLFTYSPTTQYFTRKQILTLMLAWIERHEHDPQNSHTDAALADEIVPPTYLPHKPGSYWAIFKSNKAFADDSFAPWYKTVDGKQTRPRPNNTPLPFDNCQYFVREKRAEHPDQPGLRKQTMKISDLPKAENVLFIMYVFRDEDMLLPQQQPKPKPTPAMRQMVVDAFDGRTLEAGLERLPQHVRDAYNMKQIHNIVRRMDTYVKTRTGPAPTLDPLELTTMNSCIPGFHGTITEVYVDPKKLKPGQPKTRKVAEVTYLNEDAFRAFLKGCATREQLKAHHKECARIEMLGSLQEQTSAYNNALTSLTASQLVKGVAGIIQIDTTFGLSGLYVTLVVGILTHYISERSKKNRPLILGFLMHSDRKVHHHTGMGHRINEMISHIDPSKFISAYITDGEPSLKDMCKGPAFSHAVHLRCDVHRRKNMLHKLQGVLSADEIKYFEGEMFGTKYHDALGEIVYLGGALAKMDLNRFNDDLTRIKDYFGDKPQVAKLLDRKAKDYFYSNSAMAKFRGGILSQWVTSNIIECMNHIIQRKIPRKEAAHVAAKKLVLFMKNSVNDLWKASISDCTEVGVAPTSTHMAKSHIEWLRMNVYGKRELVFFFGLPEKMIGKDSNLPQWVLENYDNIGEYILKYSVEILSDGCSYLIYKTGDRLCSRTLIIRNEYVICGDPNCKGIYRHTRIAPCRHIIVILSNMHSNLSCKFWHKYEKNFEQLTPQQRLTLTQQGGDGTKRIGNPRSKHNDIREVGMITHRSYNDPAVESHTASDSDGAADDSVPNNVAIQRMGLTRAAVVADSALPAKNKRTAPTRAAVSKPVTSASDDSVPNNVAIQRMGLTRAAVVADSALPAKNKRNAPTRAAVSKPVTSASDDSAPNNAAILRMGLTRAAVDADSDLSAKNKRNAPTRAAVSKPVTSASDDSVPNNAAILRMGLTRAAVDADSDLSAKNGLVKKNTCVPTYRAFNGASPTLQSTNRTIVHETAILGPSTPYNSDVSMNADRDHEPANSDVTGIDERHSSEERESNDNMFDVIRGGMFPEHIGNNDYEVTENSFEHLEIARRSYANVEEELPRPPTSLLRNEERNYELLDVKPIKIPVPPPTLLLVNERRNCETDGGKPSKLPRLEASPPRMNTNRPSYDPLDVKPNAIASRRVLPPRDVENFYTKKEAEAGSIAGDDGVHLTQKATTHRRSMRLASEGTNKIEIEEKPTVVSDVPKKRGRPRKILPKKTVHNMNREKSLKGTSPTRGSPKHPYPTRSSGATPGPRRNAEGKKQGIDEPMVVATPIRVEKLQVEEKKRTSSPTAPTRNIPIRAVNKKKKIIEWSDEDSLIRHEDGIVEGVSTTLYSHLQLLYTRRTHSLVSTYYVEFNLLTLRLFTTGWSDGESEASHPSTTHQLKHLDAPTTAPVRSREMINDMLGKFLDPEYKKDEASSPPDGISGWKKKCGAINIKDVLLEALIDNWISKSNLAAPTVATTGPVREERASSDSDRENTPKLMAAAPTSKKHHRDAVADDDSIQIVYSHIKANKPVVKKRATYADVVAEIPGALTMQVARRGLCVSSAKKSVAAPTSKNPRPDVFAFDDSVPPISYKAMKAKKPVVMSANYASADSTRRAPTRTLTHTRTALMQERLDTSDEDWIERLKTTAKKSGSPTGHVARRCLCVSPAKISVAAPTSKNPRPDVWTDDDSVPPISYSAIKAKKPVVKSANYARTALVQELLDTSGESGSPTTRTSRYFCFNTSKEMADSHTPPIYRRAAVIRNDPKQTNVAAPTRFERLPSFTDSDDPDFLAHLLAKDIIIDSEDEENFRRMFYNRAATTFGESP